MLKKIPAEKKIKHWEIIAIYLAVYDILAINFSYFAGLWLRFDLRYSNIPKVYLSAFLKFAPFYTVLTIFVFLVLRLYNSLWRFASFSELNRIIISSVITTTYQIVGITLFVQRMPISYYIIGAVFQFCTVTAVRFMYRFVSLERSRRSKASNAVYRAMVIGAGSAGQVIIRDLKNNSKSDIIPVCVIDDNKNKWGRFMDGIPIVGGRDSIIESVEKYSVDRILFAIPTASAEDKRDILNICSETGCKLQSLPGILQLANGEAHLSNLQPVAVEDLLGRDTIKVNMDEIYRHIKGKRILVTGGGGSIGSELCRQISEHEPEMLIVFDVYENNAYEIQQELLRKYGSKLNLVVLIGSVRDSRRIGSVFETYKPQIVYHAAAHKHVPLMEYSPCEAIKNNVIGTYKTAYYALKNGADRFILISTDKAVNPTNIMGASKRLCEMVIQAMDAVSRENRFEMLPVLHGHAGSTVQGKTPVFTGEKLKIQSVKNKNRTGTQFAAVRFGNVLGSNGSVIPLFKKQIEKGGPVTVTDPEMTRYFMTIPEAVSLVLQAGTYAWGGEIFVFDMGEPVKIDTLARNLITAAIKENKPDVIHINGLDNAIGAEVANALKIPYVWHIRQFLEDDFGQRLFRERYIYSLVQKSSDVIAISEDVKKNFEPKIKRSIKVIYNGIPQEMYDIPDHEIFSHETVKLLLAGRILVQKGQMTAIQAMEILQNKGRHNLTLTLIGQGETKEYLQYVRNYIAAHKLNEIVEIKEHSDDLLEVRREHDIGLTCSQREAFGRVTVENMMAGMLVIGANSGGTPEIITDGVDGFLYQADNPESLAAVIEKAVDDIESSRIIAGTGYKNSIARFSIKRVVDEVIGVYEKII